MTTKKLPAPLKKDDTSKQKSLFDAKGKIKQAVDFLNEHYVIHIPVNDPTKVRVECRDPNRYSESPTFDDIYLHFVEECETVISETILRKIIRSKNYIKPYDPIKTYLDSIRGKYAGKSHIDLLCSFLKFREFDADNPTYSTDRANLLIRKWFVSSIAQWIENAPNDVMLTFIQAGEGYGKTSLVNYIIPQALKDYSVTASNNDSRFDIEDAYTRFAFIVHDELIGINKGSIETWKSIMTAKKLQTKRRYEEVAIDRKRIGIAVATTNKNQENGGFIHADKHNFGSRRFGCIELEYINWEEYIKVVDPDQLWAEALMLYESSDFSWKFTREVDFHEFDYYNEKYIIETVASRYVNLFLAHPSEEEGEWMNASEILQDFRKNRLINRNDFGKIGAVSLGVSLTNLGFEYKSIRKEGKIPFKRYHVKRLYINNK